MYKRTPTNLGKIKHCKEMIAPGNFSMAKYERRKKKGQLLKNSKKFQCAKYFYKQNYGGVGQNDPPHGPSRVECALKVCY